MSQIIRKAIAADYPLLGDIWLSASIKAHSFVPDEFWVSKVDIMRDEYLPASETWVIENGGCLAGFFCLVDDVLAAIFIAPEWQGNGCGSQLMEKAKKLRLRLELSVYTANSSAIDFYKFHGFKIVEERQDVHTSCAEFVMEWKG
ncbi:GNAT family N-acetyltransferase [Desulfovibrio sp. UCD-KL4C]|uniref:GNAT family N-acetyltransferase n=1 Tax=Desulfovibrio sp. UCD-KL4C TaxID=2578120 RepID=UPI0025BCBD22|nr:GNAT family N-acetyltransferase [Desulfovibrio sp. UCD-KL4C]